MNGLPLDSALRGNLHSRENSSPVFVQIVLGTSGTDPRVVETEEVLVSSVVVVV